MPLPPPIYGASLPEQQHTFTQEFNLISDGSDALKWVTGLYYYHNTGAFNPAPSSGLAIDPTGTLVVNSYDTRGDHGCVRAVRRRHGRSGPKPLFFRRSEIQRRTQRALAQEYPDGLPAQAYGGPLPPGVTSLASQDFHSFTPRAVLRWNLGPNANLYASYAKGYKKRRLRRFRLQSGADYSVIQTRRSYRI